jgi:hypothetical protein
MKKKRIVIILLFMSSMIFAQQPIVDLDSWASQQIDSLNSHDIINYFDGGRSVTQDVTFGSDNVYTPGGTNPQGIEAVALDASHFIIAYYDNNDSYYGKVIAGTISGNQITFGSIITFNPEATSYCALAALTSTKFVLAYSDDNSGTEIGKISVCTVSGNTITIGAEQVIESGGDISYISATGIDEDDFIIAYEYANDGNAKIGRVSDYSISFGSVSIFNDGQSIRYTDLIALDESEFVISFSDNSDSGKGTVQVGTRSETSITSWGNKAVFASWGVSSHFSITGLGSNKFVVTYIGISPDNYGTVRVGDVGSGNSVTYGSEVTYNAYLTYRGVLSQLDVNNVVIAFQDRSNSYNGTAVIGTITGNSISIGSKQVYNSNNTYFNTSICMNPGKFIVAYKESYNSNYNGLTNVGEITNNLTQDIITDTTVCKNDVLKVTATTSYTYYASFNKEDEDWVNCNNVAPEIAGTNRSIFMWMKKDTQVPSGDAQMLLGLNTASGGAISNFYIGSNEKLAIHDGNNVRATSKVVTDGLWHFVGYTYDEATNETKIYADGVLLTTFTNGQSIASDGQVSLGQEFDNSAMSNYYEGKMSEVSFWNTVLTTFEIQEIMSAAINSLHPRYLSLKAYYTMIPNSDSSYIFIEDATINGNNGTASATDIQSIDIEKVEGFDATDHYSKVWKKDGTTISTDDEINIIAIDANAGNYQLQLINDFSTLEDDWTISIASLPQVTFQPHDTISTEGESAYFESSISGSSYTYQWGEVIQEFGNKTTDDGLGANHCKSIYMSDNGVLYVGTGYGLSISYDGGNSFVNKHPLTLTIVSDVFELNEVIYVSNGSGFWISTDGAESFVSRTTDEGLGKNNCNDSYVNSTAIYVATNGGLSISTDGGENFDNKTIINGLGDNECNGVFVSDGVIYVATDEGLSISTDGGEIFDNKTESIGLGDDHCNAVFVSDGVIYVATRGGFSISTDGGSSFINKTTADGLVHNRCQSVYASNGVAYVAATYGSAGGISITTDGGNSFTNKTTANGLGSNGCNDVFESNGIVYVGTSLGFSISPLWDEITGETSTILNLSPVLDIMDSSYYSIKATSSITGCSAYSDTVQLILYNSWNGSVDSDWDISGNWAEDVVPVLTDTIYIRNVPNKPIIGATESASCNHLIFCDDATLTIESNSSGTGSLIIDGSITNDKAITAQRYTTSGSWHGIASPLDGNTANTYYLDGNPEVWLKEHSESTNAYTYLTSLSTPLNDMKGFFIWVEGTGPKTFEYEGNIRIDEVGNSGNVVRSSTGSDYGWNFVGNPFTSAIDWNASSGWTKTNIDNTIYVYNSPNWSTWNGSTGTNGGTQYIASGQGFFVSVTEGNSSGTLKMDDGVKVHNSVSFLKQGISNLDNLIRLELTNNEYTDETVIHLNETATEDFDADFDAHKLFSFNTDAPQIFSSLPVKMAINSLPVSTSEVAVDITGADETNMTLSLTENSGFSNIYLSDNHTGAQINLIEDSYDFLYDSDITNRFTVYFTLVGMEEDIVAESARVYSYQNEISVILPAEHFNKIVVYNLMGQTIFETRGVPGNNKFAINKTGYYIVKVIGNNSITTKKVFIQNN